MRDTMIMALFLVALPATAFEPIDTPAHGPETVSGVDYGERQGMRGNPYDKALGASTLKEHKLSSDRVPPRGNYGVRKQRSSKPEVPANGTALAAALPELNEYDAERYQTLKEGRFDGMTFAARLEFLEQLKHRVAGIELASDKDLWNRTTNDIGELVAETEDMAPGHVAEFERKVIRKHMEAIMEGAATRTAP